MSIISSPAGMMPAPMIAATASPSLPTPSTAASTLLASSCVGRSFTVTAVLTASTPSDPVTVRQRTPRESRTGTTRHDRKLRGVRELQDRCNLRLGFRQHDRERQISEQREPIALVRPRIFGCVENRGGGKDLAQGSEQG